METMKLLGRIRAVAALLALSLLALCAGCDTGPKFKDDPLKHPDTFDKTAVQPGDPFAESAFAATIHVGDTLTVSFQDTPQPIAPVEETVKEDGTITLIYNQKFHAADKTIGDLQNEIRDRYVPEYFKFLTVSVRSQERFYSVGGEVRLNNRFQYLGKMTVLQAINTAGGFTDFASKTKVEVIRANGQKFVVNCKKAIEKPELDIEIFPGDTINVPRRW
jgi:polysaccharide export outer membrane protein